MWLLHLSVFFRGSFPPFSASPGSYLLVHFSRSCFSLLICKTSPHISYLPCVRVANISFQLCLHDILHCTFLLMPPNYIFYPYAIKVLWSLFLVTMLFIYNLILGLFHSVFRSLIHPESTFSWRVVQRINFYLPTYAFWTPFIKTC